MPRVIILFIIINIIAFFISYYAGKYIANKILKPIRNITETAENISINDLQKPEILQILNKLLKEENKRKIYIITQKGKERLELEKEKMQKQVILFMKKDYEDEI